ncbi:hypothetical protein Taro_015761 [Colocasia esculenta]|uniref:Uncharacterized protein n=1 Tax=Colocasia esculenta TaxID=4460 RepID=A0A843UN51_COLES|nr:hypothetical protein [Colocasia esculenta]
MIGEHKLKADLVCMPMEGYDVILGADWLSTYGACVDCKKGKVTFSDIPKLWLTGARGKTLVRETGLDRAKISGSGGSFREEASKGSARIEVWQDFLHASEGTI